MTDSVVHTVGRRKTAVARVFLKPGKGKILINSRQPDVYFGADSKWLVSVYQPLELLGVRDQYDIVVSVKGGGNTGQADAIRLGIARALNRLDPIKPADETVKELATPDVEAEEGEAEQEGEGGGESVVMPSPTPVELTWHQRLRKAGYLTRDARAVLRKRVGLVKARKAKQFSKR